AAAGTVTRHKYDGDRRRCFLRGDRWWSPHRDDDINLESDELGRDFAVPLGASLNPARFHCHGATIYPAEFAQSLRKVSNPLAVVRTRAANKPDGGQLLLRARRERPRSCAADERDETAPLHCPVSPVLERKK